jgi:hypothetical protein
MNGSGRNRNGPLDSVRHRVSRHHLTTVFSRKTFPCSVDSTSEFSEWIYINYKGLKRKNLAQLLT